MEKDNGIKNTIRNLIIILLIILVIIVVIGMLIINQSKKDVSQDENKNNSAVSNNFNTDDDKEQENNIITNNNAQSTNVNMLQVKSLNEIDCELSHNTITEYPNVKKDYLKSSNGKTEINISTFDTKIDKTDVYNEKTVTDGVILFYYGGQKNYIEKFNMDGKSCWKRQTSSDYEFYDFTEVTDGYFMLGKFEGKYIILKINLQGESISATYVDETITDITFIESETNNKKGYLEIIGLNNEGNVVIITYNNEGNEDKVLNTKSNNIACEKVVEKDGNYYGIGENNVEDVYSRDTTLLFKIDNTGNEIFKYNVQENKSLSEYFKYDSWLSDISVNSNYIFIIEKSSSDVYALDLRGNLVQKFGYDTNKILNQGYHSTIEYIKATDEGVLVYGTTTEPNNIDIISNDFTFQYRINISNTQLFPKSTTVNAINSSKLLENMYLNAELYDDSSIIIYQYKFN